MTMDLTARELLRAVRGKKRSQVAFARKLGYKGNPIADWEAGRRSPTACEALRALQIVGIDPVAAFSRFHPTPLTCINEQWQVGHWLTLLAANTSMVELSNRTGASRHQVSRWLKGIATPRLPDFLRMVEALTGRACELIAELVEIESVPSMLADYARLSAARRLAHEEPWTEAILRLVETRAYQSQDQHYPGRIAAALGISLETEGRCLDKLEHATIVKRANSGLYVCSRPLTVDTRAIPKLKAHWCETATERARHPQPDDIFCYNVLTASEEDLAKISELLITTYRQIRMIVKHSASEESAALLNLQLLRWKL